MPDETRIKVVIMGAAGRDFHDFNVVFRDDPGHQVVAFTAAQIPDIAGRTYPPSLSGALYPLGIPIVEEAQMPELVRREGVRWVFLSYSDLSHQDVMHKASTVLAAGASFGLLGPDQTAIKAGKPVVSIGAVRTGVGKSSLTRRVARFFLKRGRKAVAIRHPMPYGDLERQVVQRFATFDDLDRDRTTVEEREEYEPLVRMGMVVFAGVDYERIVHEAEKEAELILWDGGNNDLSLLRSNLHLVLVDPHRPGHEAGYHPGEANLRMADVVIINKVDSASPEQLAQVQASIAAIRGNNIAVILADSVLSVAQPELIRGKRVAVVGDGPTLTHGGMSFGAGSIAARRFGAAEVVDGDRFAVGSIKAAYREYPHLKTEIPALGYSPQQLADLAATLDAADADLVISGTPVDLSRLLHVNKPLVTVGYEFRERGGELEGLLAQFDRRFLGGGQGVDTSGAHDD